MTLLPLTSFSLVDVVDGLEGRQTMCQEPGRAAFSHRTLFQTLISKSHKTKQSKKKKNWKDIESLLCYSAYGPLFKVVLKLITLATRGSGMKIYRT